ncbi:hypothetical protein [Burkholderia cepacia]|uniref:hypothetical protein n=1 Tax=Burkholderia cepacia TaxID=292 RepID=UPI001CF0DF24|nr:hypothetical protein [Burkholderia cepacia]MCA8354216.1 hypothetical protein [Burkholderia cepacia]
MKKAENILRGVLVAVASLIAAEQAYAQSHTVQSGNWKIDYTKEANYEYETASNTSTNEIDLGYPYSNHSRMVMQIITKSNSDLNLVALTVGRFNCPQSTNMCLINARFDNGPIQQFHIADKELVLKSSKPALGTNMLLLETSQFINGIIHSHHLTIEANLDQGLKVYEFDVSGLLEGMRQAMIK